MRTERRARAGSNLRPGVGLCGLLPSLLAAWVFRFATVPTPSNSEPLAPSHFSRTCREAETRQSQSSRRRVARPLS